MRDLEYEKNNIGYDTQYPNGGIKCKNHIICESVLPYWWYNCKGHYMCLNCDVSYGNWNGGKGEVVDKKLKK
jgi:hypothetical protein